MTMEARLFYSATLER